MEVTNTRDDGRTDSGGKNDAHQRERDEAATKQQTHTGASARGAEDERKQLDSKIYTTKASKPVMLRHGLLCNHPTFYSFLNYYGRCPYSCLWTREMGGGRFSICTPDCKARSSRKIAHVRIGRSKERKRGFGGGARRIYISRMCTGQHDTEFRSVIRTVKQTGAADDATWSGGGGDAAGRRGGESGDVAAGGGQTATRQQTRQEHKSATPYQELRCS